MISQITITLEGLLPFLAYFGGGLLLVVLFSLVYLKVTPYDEIKLVREGKIAPAISFGGAIIGFICPLTAAIAHSVNFLDMVIWALIALVVQIFVFLLVRLTFRSFTNDIAGDKIGSGLFLAIVSVAAGLVNAASMTY
jgi:putative membrane protein